MRNRAVLFLLHTLSWLLLSCDTCHGVESDIRCLETLKIQLTDPHDYLCSWSFASKNADEGFICNFKGIECWHPDESRVLNISLSNMGLQGQFPSGLKNCTSLTGLDLSNNDLSESLPVNIDEIIPFVVTLDLSSNNFSGILPEKLGNITFLNKLNLQHNQFSGEIPWQVGRLARLTTFNVADNPLSGQIPTFTNKSFTAANFDDAGLCGKPLRDCVGPPKKSLTGVIIGAAKDEDWKGNKWAKRNKAI
ncbi:hypothetical protein MRB53_035311 [Persea americana]|uniref:Uncharacterized protein n=1 Tax=Persea americana TaxID=3435 RepID=A0ACC2K493_PERAE|nr:hypothetical protein MRB53_035311 [Persea americana]